MGTWASPRIKPHFLQEAPGCYIGLVLGLSLEDCGWWGWARFFSWTVAPPFHGHGRWEGVPSARVCSHWACLLGSGGILAPAPHGSLAAVWAEIPFFSTSGILQKEQCQRTQKKQKGKSAKALLEHETFSW